jgi:uncharacterized protein YbjT (DUF2867 family)
LTSGLRQVKEPERLQGLASRFKPTEELLAEVAAAAKPGLEWCVLRGGYFMNNLALMFGAALKGGAPAIAFPRVTCAPVDTRDIGDAAAALCLLPSEDFAKSYQGAALECSGPEELDFSRVALELGKATGRQVGYSEMGVEAWCEGKPPALQELLRYMVAEGRGAVPFAPDALTTLLGRPPRSLAEWAADHKAAFV